MTPVQETHRARRAPKTLDLSDLTAWMQELRAVAAGRVRQVRVLVAVSDTIDRAPGHGWMAGKGNKGRGSEDVRAGLSRFAAGSGSRVKLGSGRG